MKWLGAIFIVCASTSVGFLLDRMLYRRYRTLCAFHSSLLQMRPEILDLRAPMPEILRHIIKNEKIETDYFFQGILQEMAQGSSFEEAFLSAVEAGKNESSINSDDWQILSELASTLGRYGAEEQIVKLDQVCTQLESKIREAKTEREKKGKLYRSMGMAFGVTMILVFI